MTEEIRQAGIHVLLRALGMIRFVQQFETGRGDYMAERRREGARRSCASRRRGA